MFLEPLVQMLMEGNKFKKYVVLRMIFTSVPRITKTNSMVALDYKGNKINILPCKFTNTNELVYSIDLGFIQNPQALR